LHRTVCKPAGSDHLTNNPGEHLQGHETTFQSEVAMEMVMTVGDSLIDVCLIV